MKNKINLILFAIKWYLIKYGFKNVVRWYNFKFVLGYQQKKWILGLEYSPQLQLKGRLGQREDREKERLCCLGLAGLQLNVLEWHREEEHKRSILCSISDVCETATLQDYEQIGLRGCNGDFDVSHLKSFLRTRDWTLFTYHTLTALNDKSEIGWIGIANYLSLYPKIFFDKKK